MKRIIFILIVGIVMLAGCSNDTTVNGTELEQKVADLKKELQESQTNLAEKVEENEQNKQKIEELSKELKAAKLMVDAAQKPINCPPTEHSAVTEMHDADIDGNGYMDHILFYGEEGAHNFRIAIDDMIIDTNADNIEGAIKVIDIDKQDKYKELIVSENGPSSDEATYFYYLNRRQGNIVFMGKIEGKGDQLTINGDGKVITSRKRGKILHTWFHDQTYQLTSEHVLKEIPQDLYPMNSKVTVQKEIPLYKSRTSKEIAFKLKPNEQVTIVSSDDKEWCLVENAQGQQGWFAIDGYTAIRGTNYYAGEVFSGLNNAD